MIQLTGPEDKIEAFVELCRPYGIKQLSRTGVIAIARAGASGTPSAPVVTERKGRARTATPAASAEPEIALPPS